MCYIYSKEGASIVSKNTHFLLLLSMYFFKTDCIFRADLGSQRNWAEGTKSSHILPVPTHAKPPLLLTSPSRVAHLLQWINLHCHIIITQSSQLILGFTLGDVHSVDFDKWIITCIHHYIIIQGSFTALKIHCALPICPFLCPQPLTTNDIFTVSIVGIIQYIDFLGRLLSLNNIHFKSLYVFWWPNSSFLFSTE